MFWRRGYTLRGEVGGGRALEFPSFLGPVKWHRADRRVPFGPNPLQLPQVMYIHASKTLCTGMYKSPVHRLFYAHEGGLGPHTQDDPAGCVCGGRGGGAGALQLGGGKGKRGSFSYLIAHVLD
jgi:hypothetical protein